MATDVSGKGGTGGGASTDDLMAVARQNQAMLNQNQITQSKIQTEFAMNSQARQTLSASARP